MERPQTSSGAWAPVPDTAVLVLTTVDDDTVLSALQARDRVDAVLRLRGERRAGHGRAARPHHPPDGRPDGTTALDAAGR